ncbi:MAG: DUF418 domain-containing protein [Sphingobacteriia bacterium]|jgi:uncharacterized protein
MDQHTSSELSASAQIGAAPVSVADRIKSIDAIRGFALLGILMMNIPGFGMNWDFWYYIFNGPRSGYDYLTFKGVLVFFEGTMRGLFSMLFGAGMVLFMTNKKQAPGQPSVAIYYYRRLLWLVFFGVINAFVILWFGDILFFYGLFGMILFAFRKTAPKWLLIIGLSLIACAMIQNTWRYSETREKRINYLEAMAAKKEKKKLSEEQQAAITTWQQMAKQEKPDTAMTNERMRKMHSGYTTIFKYFIPQNAEGEAWEAYFGIFDMLSMMFIGMALFGWGFFNNQLSTSTYTMWMLIGYGIGIPFGFFLFNQEFVSFSNRAAYVDRWLANPNAYSEFRRLFITIGHASLIMLVYRLKIAPWLMRALSAVGQMAFTNYLMQSIICTFFFYGYGGGYYGKLYFHQIYYVVAAVWVFQLIFSSIWLRYFRFGPFEWVWRSLTYWKMQPMKL